MTRSFTLAALTLAVSLLALVPAAEAQRTEPIEVSDRMFEPTVTVEHDGTTYELHATGSHKRKKFFFSVYAAVPYVGGEAFWTRVAPNEDDPEELGRAALESGAPMRMHLKMLRGLDATRITNGINEAIDKTATRPLEEIAAERERFVQLFDGELQEDQSLIMTWLPGVGLEIRMDEAVLDTIPGDAFARTFFEIYFGPQPIDEGMREDLLEIAAKTKS